ncbi:hypothetical protein Cni_G15253 [Canna indica]|uniref:Uncharacterized protein n=1 Tax=Canna indica TaxID=4628 RepID=A0AAQ3KD21_9LILI|nr:hypothetical protein Cni_G15253 [Canna indica]
MALRYCSAPNITQRLQSNKAVIRASMLNNHSKQTSPSFPSTKSSMLHKVYEDKAMGIICYKDEKGEIICEGYDEGPRYSRHSSDQDEEHLQLRQRELLISSLLQATKIKYVQDNNKDLNPMINSSFM